MARCTHDTQEQAFAYFAGEVLGNLIVDAYLGPDMAVPQQEETNSPPLSTYLSKLETLRQATPTLFYQKMREVMVNLITPREKGHSLKSSIKAWAFGLASWVAIGARA